MMRSITVLVAVAVATAQAYSQGLPGRIVYRVDGMDDVVVKRDQLYKSVNGKELQFDLYLPAGEPAQSGWPMMVLFHGGPLPAESRPKDWPLYESYGRVIAASGMAAVVPNYRYLAADTWSIATEDANDLCRYLRAKASELTLNPDRMGLWAFSGGGPLISIALRDQLPNVRCLITFYAFLDTSPEQREFSPLDCVHRGVTDFPPMFIARAGKDRPALNRTVDSFLEAAREHQHPVQSENYAEGVHAFDVQQDTQESRDTILQAITFAKSHLLAPEVHPGPKR